MILPFEISNEHLAEYCRKHSVKKLSIFGSALREDFNDESDIDVLVEFEPGHVPGFIGLAAMEMELASILATDRKVDIRTSEEMSRYFREEVVSGAELVYGEK
ncbi:MAG: nucleotidyltransferase domain-containing protein [bacterium]|nr:nucleotidyltransferase domain-containing protein [bacterium]